MFTTISAVTFLVVGAALFIAANLSRPRRPWTTVAEPNRPDPPSAASRQRLPGLERSIAFIAIGKAQTAEERIETVERLMNQGISKHVIEDALDSLPLADPAEQCALRLYLEWDVQGRVAAVHLE